MSENNFVVRHALCVLRNTHYAIRNAKGFTLIESLVVVSILAMITLAVYASLSAGSGIWIRVNKSAGERVLFLSWEKMQKDIRNTFNFEAIGFTGKKKEISFPGLVSIRDKGGKLHQEVGRIRYYYDDKCRCLCLSRIAYADLLKNAEAKCQKEIERVKDVAFEYYNPHTGTGRDKGLWISDWEQGGRPPAVKFKVVTQDNNEKQFATLLP